MAEFSDYDLGFRSGTFDKCNGRPCKVAWNDDCEYALSLWDSGYLDGWIGNEVQISQPEPEAVEPKLTPLYFVNTGDDLIEGVYDQGGNLLGCWSPNDANWRSEYFDGFMRALGFDCQRGNEEQEHMLRHEAMELWGLTEEEAGFIDIW